MTLNHHSPTRWLAGIALVAVLAFAVACGGDEDDASDGPSVQSAGRSDTYNYSNDEAAKDGASAPPSGAIAPSAGEAQTTGGSAGGGSLPALLDRKVIRTATLSIETDAVSEDFENVGNIASSYGGFVASSSFSNNADTASASITVRVPGERYDDAIRDLRKLGTVKEQNAGSTEVTEEYTDLQSRLRNLNATEQRYIDLLSRANTIDEILTVQDRIGFTRGEIEQVQGRINLLDSQTDLATITVHLAPPIAGKVETPKDTSTSPAEVAQEAFEASIAVLLGIAIVVIAVGAFGWWLIPVGAVAYAVFRRQQRALRDRTGGTPPSAPAAT